MVLVKAVRGFKRSRKLYLYDHYEKITQRGQRWKLRAVSQAGKEGLTNNPVVFDGFNLECAAPR